MIGRLVGQGISNNKICLFTAYSFSATVSVCRSLHKGAFSRSVLWNTMEKTHTTKYLFFLNPLTEKYINKTKIRENDDVEKEYLNEISNDLVQAGI